MLNVWRTTLVTWGIFALAVPIMAMDANKVRILYVGDSSVTVGTLSAGSNFTYDQRGVSIEIAAQRILDSWRKNPRYEVTYLAGWDALGGFPRDSERLASL